MRKLAKIRYILTQPEIANFPKYLAFAGMVYWAISPIKAVGLETSADKPALLALADLKPLISLSQEVQTDPCQLILVHGSAFISQTNPFADLPADFQDSKEKESPKVTMIKKVVVTAYSSTPDQTDSSPFITAMGSSVRDGIVAANFLPFGTKIRLPEIYGDKIFVVEDRMAKHNSHKVDIWMPNRQLALQFGVKRLTLEVLE